MCTYNVRSYFFRYDNYQKYKKTGNTFILKSAFGQKGPDEIEREINRWFYNCIGASCIIEEKDIHIKESKIYG